MRESITDGKQMSPTDAAYIEAMAFREGLKEKNVDELLDDYGMYVRVKDTKLFDDELIAIRHEIKERCRDE